jgi:Holliday junction DNA helicase RuvA
MIGRLHGKIIAKTPPELLIDINGVGYEVFAPMTTFYKLPAINENVTLLIHHVVREDAQLLYGFHDEQERRLFRALIKVNGVGPKLALTILSGIEAVQFVLCVQAQDSSRLTAIPGIGKKTAERLLIETRDTLSQWDISPTLGGGNEILLVGDQTTQEAIFALTALGYKPQEAKRAVSAVHHTEHNTETLIRLALKNMLPGSAL